MRAAFGLRERHVHVVVDDDDEPDLAREVEDAVERRVGQARDVAAILERRTPCGW
jgi:3-polyprenyl-4-hydroxybenzoate decarboxylase